MEQEKKTIVVCGATGKQGGAVLNALMKNEKWNIIAISRDIDSQKASEIKNKNIKLVKADLMDKQSLMEAFKNAYGVYAMTMPVTPKGKIDTELDYVQGQNIVEACLANNIKHLVLSTVLYVEEGQENTLSYIKRKIDVENLIKQKEIPYTFLCPGSFMDDFGGEFMPVKKNKITGMTDNDVKIPQIASRDIGRIAEKAFNNPELYLGKKINLVGDFISGDELAEVVSKLTGKKFISKAPPMFLMWIFAREWIPLRKHFEKWGRSPYPQALIDAQIETKSILPDALSFEEYLKWKEWDKKLSK